MKNVCRAAGALLVLSATAFAQDVRSVELPNPMTIHTWFIIGAAGAFLAWSISYALQLQKEAHERQKERGDLDQLKHRLLDQIAALEEKKEAGEINEQKYKRELKELRFRLSKVLEKVSNPEAHAQHRSGS